MKINLCHGTWLHVEDHVQGLPVMGNLFVQAGQVELILDVVFIHLKMVLKDSNLWIAYFKFGFAISNVESQREGATML